MSEDLKEVTIYTDGAAEPNPGPGGYGVVLIYGDRRKELSGKFRLTTNNRMEILAAIAGLEALKEPCKVTLHSDSKYLVDAMTQGWASRWRANGWWRSKQDKATNIDLWERLLALCDRHQVEFTWVKGHAGVRDNERCDQLSMQFLGKHDLPADEGYDQKPETESTEHVKITHEGQPCRKCSTPVVKKTPRNKPKRDQAYYFEYYLYCPNCQTMYMVEEAKRYYE
jgi:ribonuclease HI